MAGVPFIANNEMGNQIKVWFLLKQADPTIKAFGSMTPKEADEMYNDFKDLLAE